MFDATRKNHAACSNKDRPLILKTCFDLEEQARFTQLLKDFNVVGKGSPSSEAFSRQRSGSAAAAASLTLETALRELKNLESNCGLSNNGFMPSSSGCFTPKSCSSKTSSQSSGSTFNNLLLKRRALFSSKLGFNLEEKRRYQLLLDMEKQRLNCNQQHRALSKCDLYTGRAKHSASNLTPVAAHSFYPPPLDRTKTSLRKSIPAAVNSADPPHFSHLLEHSKKSLNDLRSSSPALFYYDKTSPRHDADQYSDVKDQTDVLNGFHEKGTHESPCEMFIEVEEVDQPRPCCSTDLTVNNEFSDSNSSTSNDPLAHQKKRAYFDALSEKFSCDPSRLCQEIRSEYGPLAQIRKSEAEKLLLEAKLRLEARSAQWDSVEEEIKLRMRLEGLVLPEEEEEEAEEEEFKPLTDEQLDSIRRALKNASSDAVVAKTPTCSITKKDLISLQGSNWLNDEVINFYFALIVERSGKNGLPSCYAFNTFFYPKLMKDGYNALKRWTRKVDIFSYDLILIPVHLGVHWCLATIDFRSKVVSYYDSMNGSNFAGTSALLDYLVAESKDKKQALYDTSDWQEIMVEDIPQQMNGCDCGMFACKFAEYVSRDARINFSQQHMAYFRARTTCELLACSLL